MTYLKRGTMYYETDLREYQTKSIDFGMKNTNVGYFLDMGLGKTVISLAVANKQMFEELNIRRVLVVATKMTVVSVWQEQPKEWDFLKHLKVTAIVGNPRERLNALRQKTDIYAISRDNLTWLSDVFDAEAILPFDMLIVDESSGFKDIKTKRFKALRSIARRMKKIIILTGTPAANSLLDLWAQLYLLDRGKRLERTITTYRTMYFRPIVMGQFVKYELLPESEEIIYDKIKDICVSMKSIDHLNMPDLIVNDVYVTLSESVKKQYDDFEKEKLMSVKSSDEEITAANAAALSSKLLQFANGAVYDTEKTYHVVHDEKIEKLIELIEELNGEPALVAYAFVSDLLRIQKALQNYNVRHLKTEADLADWNNRKIRVAIAHPESIAFGVNLQKGGHNIIFFGLTYKYALYTQFISRLHRQGQKSKFVVVTRILCKNTHDEDVAIALSTKEQTLTKLMASLKMKIANYRR